MRPVLGWLSYHIKLISLTARSLPQSLHFMCVSWDMLWVRPFLDRGRGLGWSFWWRSGHGPLPGRSGIALVVVYLIGTLPLLRRPGVEAQEQ